MTCKAQIEASLQVRAINGVMLYLLQALYRLKVIGALALFAETGCKGVALVAEPEGPCNYLISADSKLTPLFDELPGL